MVFDMNLVFGVLSKMFRMTLPLNFATSAEKVIFAIDIKRYMWVQKEEIG